MGCTEPMPLVSPGLRARTNNASPTNVSSMYQQPTRPDAHQQLVSLAKSRVYDMACISEAVLRDTVTANGVTQTGPESTPLGLLNHLAGTGVLKLRSVLAYIELFWRCALRF